SGTIVHKDPLSHARWNHPQGYHAQLLDFRFCNHAARKLVPQIKDNAADHRASRRWDLPPADFEFDFPILNFATRPGHQPGPAGIRLSAISQEQALRLWSAQRNRSSCSLSPVELRLKVGY